MRRLLTGATEHRSNESPVSFLAVANLTGDAELTDVSSGVEMATVLITSLGRVEWDPFEADRIIVLLCGENALVTHCNYARV